MIIVVWHIAYAARPRAELLLILMVAAIGAAYDSALVALGWVDYPSGMLLPGTAPHWIVALWMLFATTLNVSLRWLRRSRLAAAALGAVGGLLAYWGGARLGAMELVVPFAAAAAIALGWAVLTPCMVWLAQRFDGCAPTTAATMPPEPHRA